MNNLTADLTSSMTLGFSSILTIIVSMLLALVLGYAISWIYRKNYRGVMFSGNFALTLIMMTVVTTPVVLCIRNSIALSMGMVGALSIVRFRTAVKDPLDTAYMFWALTTGILLGAGQFLLTAVEVVVIGLILTVLVNVHLKGVDSYLLVVRAAEGGDRAVTSFIGGLRHQRLKSRNISSSGVELTYEIRTEKPEALLHKINSMSGVHEATLVSYQGEAV